LTQRRQSPASVAGDVRRCLKRCVFSSCLKASVTEGCHARLVANWRPTESKAPVRMMSHVLVVYSWMYIVNADHSHGRPRAFSAGILTSWRYMPQQRPGRISTFQFTKTQRSWKLLIDALQETVEAVKTWRDMIAASSSLH